MRITDGEQQDLSLKRYGSVKIKTRPLKPQGSAGRLFSSPKASRPSPTPESHFPSRTPSKNFPPLSSPSLSPESSSGEIDSLGSNQDGYFNSNFLGTTSKTLVARPTKTEAVFVPPIQKPKPRFKIEGVHGLSTAATGSVNASSAVTPIGNFPGPIRTATFPLLPQRSSSLASTYSFNTRSTSLAAPNPVIGRIRGASTSSQPPIPESPPLAGRMREPLTSSQSHIHHPIPRRFGVPFIAPDGYPQKQPMQQNNDFGFEDEIEPVSEERGYPSDLYQPLQFNHDTDEVRTSFRSALTSNSSLYNTTSTERSSVATATTSIGGLIFDSHRPVSKHASMTVDDAIDMYAAGFTDDVEEPEHGSSSWSLSQGGYHEPVKTHEGTIDKGDESFNYHLRPLARPSSARSNSSAAIISGNAPRSETPSPLRQSMSVDRNRDQYGFLKETHHITNEEHDAWSSKYSSSQERRSQKWLLHMQDHTLATESPSQFPPRSAKTQRFIRKGIPPDWRGNAWFFYAGGYRFLDKQPGLFSNMVALSPRELSSNDKDMIERDLHRTFPDNVRFKPESSSSEYPIETPLLSSLRRVLQAFALYCPRIGYCQSLNFIAGLLLLFLPEEKAFWMLHIITTEYLPGTHDVSLEGANVDLWVLMIAFKESMPQLWPKIGSVDGSSGPRDARLPTISLCTTSWFMSLFIGTLPIESVLRVWDILFYEGSRTLFRIALAIFKLGEQRIKAISDPMEIFQIVQALPRGMLDVGTLMEVAFRRGGVSQEWVEKRRRQRKKWYARARAQAADAPSSSPPAGGAATTATAETAGLYPANSTVGKVNSVWRRAGQRMVSAN